jgi:hypothetical protein
MIVYTYHTYLRQVTYLKAQKVNIKIKTINFEIFTRTKSLTCYTNELEKIFEAAKFLLLNEWTNSKGTLKLRLIGCFL